MVKCKFCGSDLYESDRNELDYYGYCLCGASLSINYNRIVWVERAYDIYEIKDFDKSKYEDSSDFAIDDENFED